MMTISCLLLRTFKSTRLNLSTLSSLLLSLSSTSRMLISSLSNSLKKPYNMPLWLCYAVSVLLPSRRLSVFFCYSYSRNTFIKSILMRMFVFDKEKIASRACTPHEIGNRKLCRCSLEKSLFTARVCTYR